jgi:hypothetical protein
LADSDPSPTSDFGPDPAVTIDDYLRYLVPGLTGRRRRPPDWPPDVFAVAASLLLQSGAYLQVVSKWPPLVGAKPQDWARRMAAVGQRWRETLSCPGEVRDWWRTLRQGRGRPLAAIERDEGLCHALVQLCAAADEASYGVGYPFGEDLFDYLASEQLLPDDHLGSTLSNIHPSRALVLPKCHTPQGGITLDSLFQNLTLWPGGDVKARWYTALHDGLSELQRSFNLLLVPWPGRVSPMQFNPAESQRGRLANMPESYGFFCYQRASDPEALLTHLARLQSQARMVSSRIDLIVLPELALNPDEYEVARAWAREQKSLLLCGVGEPSRGADPGRNYVALEPVISRTTAVHIRQHKHHRWRLDKSQIVQYGLGGQLDPSMQWWEHTAAEARNLTFVSLLGWLSFCFLVCEDLARQEPVARMVRAVGPNLVIALLMDGPQLASRWPARYATVLADDPGCSVLTLTSLGMAELSRPAGVAPSRAIGLWKDSRSWAAREIVLPQDASGVVLNLARHYEVEWSADGRSDQGVERFAGYPILAGVHPV